MQRIVLWLCLVMIFTIPWENILEYPGLGTISRVAGFVLAAVWLGSAALSGRLRTPRRFHIAVFLFVVWNTLSYFWTVDPENTIQRFLTYVQILVLVYVLWDTITTLEGLDLALEAYVLGAWVTGIILILGYLYHGQAGLAGHEVRQRFTAGTFQVDDVALIFALGIPPAWYLTVQGRGKPVIRLLRWANFLYVPLAVVSIMLTGSRAAMVSVAAGGAYILASLSRLTMPVRVMVLVVLVGLVLFLATFVPSQTLERLETTHAEATGGDLNGRLPIWRQAFAKFQDHPLLGIGANAFRTNDTHKRAHNFVLGYLAEVGLIGFGLFVTILVLIASSALAQRGALLGLWISVLVTWLIGASLYNFEEKKQSWLFFALIVVGAGLVQKGPPPRETAAAPSPGRFRGIQGTGPF